MLYVCNVEEAAAGSGNAFSARVAERAAAEGAAVVVISAAIEAEVSQLAEADRREFLEGLGLHDSGLDRVIRAGYALLGLLTFFTVGPKEARAWTIVNGTKAPQAAAVIHKDFERWVHRGDETIAYDDFAVALERRAAGEGEARQDVDRGKGIRGAGRRRPLLFRAVQRLKRISRPTAFSGRPPPLRPSPSRGGGRSEAFASPLSP